MYLKNALYIPTFKQNIFSVQAAAKNDAHSSFEHDNCQIIYPHGAVFNITQRGHLYYLKNSFYQKCHLRGGKKKKKSTTTTIEPTEKQITATTVTTASTVTTTKEKQPSSSSPRTKKNKDNKDNTEVMDTTTNLKRRRDSGDSSKEEGDKKHLKKPAPKLAREPEKGSHPQTPPLPQPKEKKQIKSPDQPAQIIPPPQKTQNTQAHLSDFPLSPKSPSLSPITTPKILLRSHSVTRESPTASSSSSSTGQKQRSRLALNEVRRAFMAFHYCQDVLEPQNMDHI